MPELPEVETVRDGLARHVLGRTIAAVDVLHPRAVRRQEGGEPAFESRLVGRRFTAARRRGKYLWLVLAPEPIPGAAGSVGGAAEEALLAHLGMSGQLLVRGGDEDENSHRHLRVRITFEDGGELWFVDQRTFGHLMVADLVAPPDAKTVRDDAGHCNARVTQAPSEAWGAPLDQGLEDLLPAPVAHIARDLLDPCLDVEALVRATRQRRTEIKRALLDQTLVSGIGNIYADEALWRARVHGERRTDGLAPATLRRLYAAAADVMTEALAQGGTSFDALYVHVDGESGYFERSLDAYGRAGLPCRRCGTPIVRATFMNRGSHFCPRCQRKRS